MPKQLASTQQRLLLEALRRFTRFGDSYGGHLLYAWTGLGSATQYKPAVDAGLMECATRLNPGFSTWWRLTKKGAQVVQKLLDYGFDYSHVESGLLNGIDIILDGEAVEIGFPEWMAKTRRYEVERNDGDLFVGLGHSYAYYEVRFIQRIFQVSSDPKSTWEREVTHITEDESPTTWADIQAIKYGVETLTPDQALDYLRQDTLSRTRGNPFGTIVAVREITAKEAS